MDDSLNIVKANSLPEVGRFDIADGLNLSEKIQIFTEIAKGSNTGITDVGQALLVYQKANELGIGWANAISHMSIIKGKAGIDIHIIKAILSKPASGVTWDCVENYKPIYKYTDGDEIFIGLDSIPVNCQLVKSLDAKTEDGKIPIVILPEVLVVDGKKKAVIQPYDYRTKYVFTRLKKHIDGSWITVKSEAGVFSWRDALTAGLPYNKAGELDPSSAWQAYRQVMLAIRAFTFGARDIASDLLMGCYEKTELYDMNKVAYSVTEDGKATVVG